MCNCNDKTSFKSTTRVRNKKTIIKIDTKGKNESKDLDVKNINKK